jgi:hypothetical protein
MNLKSDRTTWRQSRCFWLGRAYMHWQQVWAKSLAQGVQ